MCCFLGSSVHCTILSHQESLELAGLDLKLVERVVLSAEARRAICKRNSKIGCLKTPFVLEEDA